MASRCSLQSRGSSNISLVTRAQKTCTADVCRGGTEMLANATYGSSALLFSQVAGLHPWTNPHMLQQHGR